VPTHPRALTVRGRPVGGTDAGDQQGAAAVPENNPALARGRFILGHPCTLVMCLLVLGASWALLGMTRVRPAALVFGRIEFYLPRLEGWDLSPATSARSLLLAPVTGRPYVLEVRERGNGWDTQTKGSEFLVLARTTLRKGVWAPVTERVEFVAYTGRAGERVGGLPKRLHNLRIKLMTAVPAEHRGAWAVLWPPGGAPKDYAEIRRTLWWGYVWNCVCLAALVGVFVWPFVAPFCFLQRREERRRVRGQCVRCAYKLKTDTVTLETCPECGAKSVA